MSSASQTQGCCETVAQPDALPCKRASIMSTLNTHMLSGWNDHEAAACQGLGPSDSCWVSTRVKGKGGRRDVAPLTVICYG